LSDIRVGSETEECVPSGEDITRTPTIIIMEFREDMNLVEVKVVRSLHQRKDLSKARELRTTQTTRRQWIQNIRKP